MKQSFLCFWQSELMSYFISVIPVSENATLRKDL